MIFELRDLTIGYREGLREKVIAKGLNAKMQGGMLICLVGRNGIGKSTLLRTLSGFQPALSGDMLLDGKSIVSFDKRQMSETISVVLTERADFQNLTVTDVVGMGRMPYTNFWGTLHKEDKQIVADAIAAVGMTAFAQSQMTRLSDGERQKVMIAKAIAQQTPLILLDEPTAFLDYPSKTGIVELLLDLAHKQDKIIFLSTHDLDVAYRLADSIWMMDEKGLSLSVTSEQLLALNFHPV
ncbi:MAG: ABC transporter ATP-binding protein [Bacteroidaceae bacterium]|nr:ABC transporter ATP-binding protein [Bacteroidaceae bacterium]MBP5323251.1 ABC transporter ATP-binding protein [Bacteroidaceae bacterium]